MEKFTFDSFDKRILDPLNAETSDAIAMLHKGFTSSVKPENGVFMSDVPHGFAQIQKMYQGTMINGQNTLGLKALSRFKINPDFTAQNIKQQSGFAAEIISTAKENIQAIQNKTGIVTFRADDRPDLFPKNDQYVDKIKVNSSGDIIERIQSKFVGGNGKECVSKLLSTKFDKYFTNGKVDKIEIPSDYFDDALQAIADKVSSFQKQLARVTAEGKVDVAEQLQKKINRCNQLEGMLQKSVVSSDEAIYARLHPKRYAAKMFAKPTLEASAKSGLTAAALTTAVSTVDNVRQCLNGEITPQEAFVDVAKDTGVAGAVGYGTAFVSSTVASAMQASSHALIKSLGNLGNGCVPAAVISFGVQSFDSVVDFAQGEINGKELALELGESAAAVGGGLAGGMLAGAAAGSVLPGAGTFVGGLVGGMVGCALASEAYATIAEHAPEAVVIVAEKADTAVEFIADKAEYIADKAQTIAEHTGAQLKAAVSETAKTAKILTAKAETAAREAVDSVKEHVPEKIEDIRSAINNFFADTKMPIHI